MEIILSQLITPSKLFQRLMICAACLVSVSQVHAQDSRVAIFDSQRVIRESAPAKAAEVKIEQEFSKRSKDLQDMANKFRILAEKFDKDAPVLGESDRIKRQRELTDLDQDIKRKQRVFSEDLNQRKNEEIAALLERASKIVKQIAEAEKYDLVLQDAVYHNPRIDITDKVLKALTK
ncbi:MAG: OmpH family outer membrane protein [Undibacterium curvum]|uniref:OmpH family outer membrane protein n=1 Tax=Undibacterium curvum TaxID=2762294 RepID=UPI003BE3D8FE